MTPAAALSEIAQRGLFVVDDGDASRPVIAAADSGFARGLRILDGSKENRITPERLVGSIGRGGCAIRIATGTPENIATMAALAHGLAGRGIALVPVSACIRTGHGLATQP